MAAKQLVPAPTPDAADTAEYTIPPEVKSESARAREVEPDSDSHRAQRELHKLGIADAEHTTNIAGNHGRFSQRTR
jgi:hypothetical protein